MEDRVWITIKNFNKYKGRSDVKNNSWFRCSNRLLEDPSFYNFTHSEICVWIYVLCLVSEQNNAVICLFFQRAERIAKLSENVILSALEKLKENNTILEYGTRPVRVRNVKDTRPVRERIVSDRQTLHTEQDRTDSSCIQNVNATAATENLEDLFEPEKEGAADKLQSLGGKSTSATPARKSFDVIDSLKGNDLREQALSHIAPITQNEWAKKYDLEWLKHKLDHAVQHHMTETNASEAAQIDDWGIKLVRWLNREKKPHLANPGLFQGHPTEIQERKKAEAREQWKTDLGPDFVEEDFEQFWKEMEEGVQ